MIDEETKEKLIHEIEKSGNAYLSCLKVNVDKATYYRWKKEDKEFAKKSKLAEKLGRENNCDVAEHALMINVKAGKIDSIKYVLGHNSPRYKEKQTSNVVILHKKGALLTAAPKKSWEESVKEMFIEKHQKAIGLFGALASYHRKFPNKFDGSPIEIDEMIEYEGYIKNCYEMSSEEATKRGITWRDIDYYKGKDRDDYEIII